MKSDVFQSPLIIILVGIIFICGCANQQVQNPEINISNGTPEHILVNLSNDTSDNLSAVVQPPEIFGVKINSWTCKWTVKTNEYNVKSDCVQAIAKGTAIGPVGARVELPLAVWSDDIWDCGEWTHKTGALIAVGHTCVRSEGQPEATNWTVDTGSDNCPLKNYFDNERSYSAKIYKDDELEPRQSDSKSVVCQ